MVYFQKIISSLRDKEIKGLEIQSPFKLSGRFFTKFHIILEMESWIATLSKVKNLLLFGRKTNKEITKQRKIYKFLMMC